MRGFGGEDELAARLTSALHALLEVFPLHLEPGESPGWVAPEELAKNDRFDAIVRAHKKERLTMPVPALLREGLYFYNLEGMKPRRLAWFVPSLLASWLEAPASGAGPLFDGHAFETILEETSSVSYRGPVPLFAPSLETRSWSFAPHEVAALVSFFDAALRAALATPVSEPSRAFETVRLAAWLYGGHHALAVTWTRAGTRLAVEHLLAAVANNPRDVREYLGHASMVEWLERAFFETPARAAAISDAVELLTGALG